MLRDIEAIQEHTISESTIPDRKLLIPRNFSLQVLLALSSVRRGRVFPSATLYLLIWAIAPSLHGLPSRYSPPCRKMPDPTISRALVDGSDQIASDHASKEVISGRLYLSDQIGLIPRMGLIGTRANEPMSQ